MQTLGSDGAAARAPAAGAARAGRGAPVAAAGHPADAPATAGSGALSARFGLAGRKALVTGVGRGGACVRAAPARAAGLPRAARWAGSRAAHAQRCPRKHTCTRTTSRARCRRLARHRPCDRRGAVCRGRARARGSAPRCRDPRSRGGDAGARVRRDGGWRAARNMPWRCTGLRASLHSGQCGVMWLSSTPNPPRQGSVADLSDREQCASLMDEVGAQTGMTQRAAQPHSACPAKTPRPSHQRLNPPSISPPVAAHAPAALAGQGGV